MKRILMLSAFAAAGATATAASALDLPSLLTPAPGSYLPSLPTPSDITGTLPLRATLGGELNGTGLTVGIDSTAGNPLTLKAPGLLSDPTLKGSLTGSFNGASATGDYNASTVPPVGVSTTGLPPLPGL